MTIVRRRRWLSLGILLLLAFVLPALGQARGEPVPSQQQTEPNRAGLVIRHGDGRVVTACVSFDEPSISGLELLQRAGVPFLAQQGGIGAAVCKIDGEGCDYPAEDCFCKRDGPKSIYWAYNRLTADGWMLSPLGASSTRVQPGAVEGWAWGSGSVNTGAQPPLVSFDEVCPAQASAPVPPTSTPTFTPVPPIAPPPPTPVPPTSTPQPTATPPPTETPQPSATPQPQSAPAAPTNTPRPTSAPATPTASRVPQTPSATPVLPSATPQPTDASVAPTVPPTGEPELALAATSAPPAATSVPPTVAASPVPVQTPRPTLTMPTQTPLPTLAAPTSAPAPQATAEGAGIAIAQPAPPDNARSNYVIFAILACALISAILAIYAQRMR